MTKIIVMSDTHLERSLPEKLVELAKGADLILHAGDFVDKEVYDSLADLGRVKAVCGNADSPELKMLLPERKVIDVDGVRIGLVHMASHSSGPGTEMLAREMEVDVLVYGHLHRPLLERNNKLLISPGSPTVPDVSANCCGDRDKGRKGHRKNNAGCELDLRLHTLWAISCKKIIVIK